MRISQLKINSYRGIDQLEINFSQPSMNYFKNLNVSILVGENGTGKTTILKLLSKIFCPYSTKEREEQLAQFSIKYELNGKHYITSDEKIEGDQDILYPAKLIVSSFSVFDPYLSQPNLVNNKFIPKLDPTEYVYCGPNSNMNVSSVSSIIPYIMNVLYGPDSNALKAAILKRLLNNINYGPVQFYEVSLNKRHYGMEARGPSDLTEPTKITNKIREFYEKLKTRRIKSKNKPKSKSNTFVIKAEDFDNTMYETYQYLVEYGYGTCIRDIWFAKEGQDISLSSMSSGEITMLYRFVPLILKMEHNSLLLIDEPETHLHPRWIQQYIENLIELLGDYKSHVIIATHSPTIASEAPTECIIGLEKQKEQDIKVYHVKNRTLGGDPSKILKDVFHLDTYRGHFASDLMNQVVDLLRKGDEDSKEKAMQIYHDLSTTMDKFKFFIEHEDLLEE